MNDLSSYSTRDLGEATALLTSGCVMKDLQWQANKAYFVFDDAEHCKELSQQYFFGGLSLTAKFFYENLRTIKRKLYSEQNARNRGGVSNNV